MLKNVPISKDANLAVSHLLMMVNHIASMENKLIAMATWTAISAHQWYLLQSVLL